MSSGEKVSFAEAFSEVSRGVKKFKQNQYGETGIHPIIDQGQEAVAGYSDEESGLFTDVPAIVFGDHTRCVKYVDVPFFAGADGVKILKPKLSDNTRFWWHALKATPIENLGYSRHFKLLKTATFELYDESRQAEIVAALDGALARIDHAEQQIAQLDQLVKSRFVEMFIGKGFPTTTIGESAADIRYGTSEKAGIEGEFVYLRMNNMTDDGKLDTSDVKHITLSGKALENCLVKKGDLLFNRTNSREKVGKTCVFELDEPMVIAGYIIRVRLNESVESRYLSTYMNLGPTKAKLRSIAKGAVHQANINAKQLAAIEFPLPPLALQQNFAAFVVQVDKTRAIAQQQVDKLQTLYDSLAQDYFA